MNPFRREQYEDRQYPVDGRNLRGYKGAFERAGYPTQIAPTGAPGIYIIMVSLPQSMPQQIDPYSLPARRHYRTDWRRGATVTLTLLAAGMVAWFAWTLFAPSVQPTAATEPAAPAWRWPWQSDAPNGEPVVELLPDDGWRWPWDAAADAAADAVQTVQSTITTVLAVILAVLVLSIILALLRRRG